MLLGRSHLTVKGPRVSQEHLWDRLASPQFVRRCRQPDDLGSAGDSSSQCESRGLVQQAVYLVRQAINVSQGNHIEK